MNKKSCLWLGLFVLIIVCIVGIALVYFQERVKAFNLRPLVLIHSPINHEQVQVGNGVIVHATAREEEGLRRIELWANNTLVDARDADEGTKPSMLVFSGTWIPRVEANHVLIVRAIAANGTEGQASVVVTALEETEAAGEGRIPTDDGSSEGSEAGGGGGSFASGADSEPPSPQAAPPDTVFLFFSAFPFIPPLPFGQAEPFDRSSDPTGLRLEFLGLTTNAAYDQLQCYVGFAGAPPRRYPDQDGDETTDESFVPQGDEAAGGENWNVESLSGEDMPVLSWPRNQNLPINVSCVGIAGGGTDSVELGLWEGNVSPDRWTGMTLTGGVPGSYEFTFLIRRTQGRDRRNHGIPIFLDSHMEGPTIVWLDDSRGLLRWEYTQPADEEPIDGFRIYLNDTLQWVRGPDIRESRLPYEWFHPLCGTSYKFGVSSYRQGLPDGPESYPVEVTLEQSEEDCNREVLVTFLTLETFDLGDDQSGNNNADVGPVYGYLYANEQQVTFDGGDIGPGLDTPAGFYDNSSYIWADLSHESGWHFSDNPEILVGLEDEGVFEFGFRIDDEDSGRCHDSDDGGCPDLVCEGHYTNHYSDDPTSAYLDQHNEGEILSENGRCRVTYQYAPALGSPTGSGGDAGGVPLPWIALENFAVDETSGRVLLHIRNTGAAGWRDHDLGIELQNREGVSLGIYTWPGFDLEAGQRTVLENPEMRLVAPFDACVVIDPFDEVLERHEGSGFRHEPICAELPDLTISDVHFESGDGEGQLHFTVENIGDGPLEERSVSVQVSQTDGTPLSIVGTFPDISLVRFETVPLEIGGVNEATRNQMRAGYSVVVNPEGTILESESTNNTFDVPGASRLQVKWRRVTSPYQQRNSSSYYFDAYVVSGETRRQIADWYIENVDWGEHACQSAENCIQYFGDDEYYVYWFDIFGDERLEISAEATQSTIRVGAMTWDWGADTNWGGGYLDATGGCGTVDDEGRMGYHRIELGWMPGPYRVVRWDTEFAICDEALVR